METFSKCEGGAYPGIFFNETVQQEVYYFQKGKKNS
jgi:hypothetical protein